MQIKSQLIIIQYIKIYKPHQLQTYFQKYFIISMEYFHLKEKK